MKRFKPMILLTCVLLVLGVVAVLAYSQGTKDTVAREMKLYGAILESKKIPPGTMFSEFAKARYYSLALGVSSSVFKGWASEYGPIDADILKGLPFGKGPLIPDEVYRSFSARRSALVPASITGQQR